MKKILIPIVFAGLLVGCTQSEDNELEVKPTEDEAQPEAQLLETLTVSEENIRFIVGWLNEKTILYVDHQDEEDRLQSFDLKTGDTQTLFTEASTISEVQVHPSASQLLVKTADDSTEALLHILDTDGTLLNEVSVESSEVEIQWNDSDASQILITAFAEDWSYQVMRYDASDDTLVGVDIDDPFAQWLGADELVYMVDTAVLKQSLTTGEKTTLAKDVSQFNASADQVLIEAFDETRIRYKVVSSTGEEKSTWLAEDSSFMMEHAAFIDEDTVVMSITNQTELAPTSFLVKIEDGEEVKRYALAEGGSLDCKGNKCLTGYSLDTWVDVDTGETVKWLEMESGVQE